MSTISQTAPGRPMHFAGLRGFADRYFYFAMSLLFPVIVVWGFSRTVNENLFRAAVPRPRILWFHGAAFSAWVCCFISFSQYWFAPET